jgi:FMN phosphatase YigB (HAD superfamily)/sugar phosphate isomerase/epimerase
MTNQIEAILFDMGGTLRSTTMRLPEVDKEKIHEMIVLLGMDIDEAELIELLHEHARDYRNWAKKTLLELNEVELWTRWMLPDCPSDQVSQLALQLSQLWRDATGRHVVFPETQETVLALFRRGYRLGLVSNTTSSVEAPRVLQELGIAGCFDTVVLSCDVGIRKPDPSILLMAAERMGIRPEYCVYIGDQPRRDVAAAREAGFARTVILRGPKSPPDLPQEAALIPEHTIYNLTELLDIFPPRSAPRLATVYNASLSTMWAMKNFPTLVDFFEAARRMGFARIELNHKVTTPMLEGIDLSQYQFSSIHEPCPADISEDELKKRDWLISSTDEACRAEGVKAMKRSIDLAYKLGVPAIVIHAGHPTPDKSRENKLRALIESGWRESDEYRDIQKQMIRTRAEVVGAPFEALKKSVTELLAYAEPLGIRLGLENRYHYTEFPSPDELEILLNLAGADRIGYIFDVGHAQTLDRLGFYPLEVWLKRFSSRIIGTHLHDVIGTTDHYASGLGEVDFDLVAKYLPADAFRTCEFQESNTPEQVKAGLKFLVEHGCIKNL